MNILFITNLIPFPLDNGGKIKSYNTLKMLSEENKIDIFSFYESDRELASLQYMKSKFNDATIFYKPLTTKTNIKKMLPIAFRSLFSKLPFVILKYKDKRMKEALERAIQIKKYDLIYIDHLQLGVYWNELKKADCPIYLDQHNCESQILKRKISNSGSYIKNKFVENEYKKLHKFENDMLIKCNKVIVLSEEDKKNLIGNLEVSKKKFITIPIPMEIDYKKKIGNNISGCINLMFLGTLSWFPNSNGIEWFIENVIPELEKKGIKYKLYIVGKDPSETLAKRCEDNKNIIITGYVDDVNEYIEKCDVMIVPIFIGSGMRVKVLEGLGKRIPIISTRIGAEGINVENGENILFAENKDEFTEAINTITNGELFEKLQKNGEILFDSNYSLNAISKKYKKFVIENLGEENKVE